MKTILTNLSLSLICVLLIKLFNYAYPSPSIYNYAAFLLLILVFYSLVLPTFLDIGKMYIRYKRKIFPSIAILNGNIQSPVGEYKCKRHCIGITPGTWLKHLKLSLGRNIFRKLNLNMKFIPIKGLNDSWSIVINPFGDNFPEENTMLLTSFYKICEYVKNGGFFVCTGGAFYWHQNTKNSEEPKQVIAMIINGAQSLEETLLFKELGVLCSGDGSPNENKNIDICQWNEDKKYLGDLLGDIKSVKKFRSTTPKSTSFLPLVREANGETFPVVAIPYGKGFFIHFGIWFDSADSSEFKIMTNVIDSLIMNRFKIF